MNIRDELADLAKTLDPRGSGVCFTISTEPWPAEYAGQSGYVDAEGVLHFTLMLDRPRGDDGDSE